MSGEKVVDAALRFLRRDQTSRAGTLSLASVSYSGLELDCRARLTYDATIRAQSCPRR